MRASRFQITDDSESSTILVLVLVLVHDVRYTTCTGRIVRVPGTCTPVRCYDTLYVVIVHSACTIRSCDEPSRFGGCGLWFVVCGVWCRVFSNHESRVVTGLTSYFTSHTVQGTSSLPGTSMHTILEYCCERNAECRRISNNSREPFGVGGV